MIAGALRLCVVIASIACSACALAHQMNLTTARIVLGPGRTVDVEIAMKGGDVDRVADAHVVDDGTGLVRPEMLAAASAAVMRYMRTHAVVLGSDAAPCRAGADTVASDGDGAVIHI